MTKLVVRAATLAVSLARVPSAYGLTPAEIAADAVALASLRRVRVPLMLNSIGVIASRYDAEVVAPADPLGMALGFRFSDPGIIANPSRILFVL